jgi:hypothetical protein
MVVRVTVLVLIAVSALAPPAPAGANSRATRKAPELPVVSYNACPGRVVENWEIVVRAAIYSLWQSGRTKVGIMNPGDKVTVLKGAGVTRLPDKILVTKAMPDLSLLPGDVILRYWYYEEGVADIWANGQWHDEYDLSSTTEKEGTGCTFQGCDSVVKEDGIKEGWVQVKTASGIVGWARAFTSTRGAFVDARNFNQLCSD